MTESSPFTTDDGAPHTWNYRVHGYTYYPNTPGGDPEEVYQIIEAYYDQNDNVVAWAEVSAHGESLGGLRDDLQLMVDATRSTVLADGDLPGGELPGGRKRSG